MSATLEELKKEKSHVIAIFNHTLISLINTVIEMDPDSGHLKSLRNKINIATSADEEILIKTSGPYFIKYQSEIVTRNIAFFNTPGYLEEQEALLLNSKAPDGTQSIRNILNLCRQVYNDLDEVDQDNLYKRVLDMFDRYLEFIKLEKAIMIKLAGLIKK
jgi:hypothetical protein